MSGTGRLEVLIGSDLYPQADGSGSVVVAGTVIATSDGVTREILVPLGGAAEAKPVELEPGHYVVQATLPSGRVLCTAVEVAAGGTARVELAAYGSPHETHAFQYAMGNLQTSAGYERANPRPLYSPHRELLFDSSPLWAPASVRHLVAPAAPGYAALNAAPSLHALADSVVLPLPGTPVGDPVPSGDTITELYRFGAPGGASPAERHYLTIAAEGTAHLATLPVPWIGMDGTGCTVEVMLNRGLRPVAGPVTVTVWDARLGGGLAYLGTGALMQAATVFRDVQAMLLEKASNPLAAAAAAYVLVGTEGTGTLQPWDPWLENLAAWFPSLADGLILCAARRLRTAGSEAAAEAVKPLLAEAFGRGLPAYTLGLVWLADLLAEFPEDPDFARMHQEVRRLSWRVDMHEPFVVIKFEGE